MQFKLTEEHEMIRKMVRDFAQNEVAPTAAERDEEERFDREIFDKMAELGLTGIPWPEEYGGIGSDYLAYCIAVEELSRVCASTGVTLSAHTSLAGWPIYKFGTEEQKQKYLRPMAQGEKIGAYGLTEPSSGSDAGGMRTTAKLVGDEYVISGSKIFITNGGIADTYVVFALTDPESKQKGTSAFIIEKDFPGFSVGKKEKKLGIRSSPTTEIIFDECRVPKENLLGKEGEGFKIAMMTLDGGRNGIAAQAVGIAQGALDAAVDYAKERVQFGKPISAQQGIGFKLADMATGVEASRLLTYQAAWLESVGLPYGKESAMSKLFAGDTAMKVTTEAVQVFGGYGYTKDYPVERYMRDAKITQIYEGTQEIQKLVISRMVTK
ncbi:acyl-CoA dehydrogenase [Peribacillus frigoritolerans]|jgi:alkylation response protein AidB-like acyl-CoA dehydrogenase|uniref:Acyl-CoA dehydrogenase n=1 Tax=Peribacillus castrilensis TaxID=2897690 RepID=A0AAW9N1J7_9BACI|nr:MULTISPECIES: acyl-CoA dehydrogenase [Bacillaceae]KOR81131.1 acyl-CoA dehydrogenase [Bacillus sp. FJAT-21352]KOR85190.1 acyl-CoA dehydrogenase [Bacillus sp. FJAT-22058]KRF50887.1 acyl-CoA dehydrogenase [Bacillus sp. Soil745]MBD8137885.1 acyl-CoA dehydrogenase [Bacillus sp. CFBP 13597]MBT2604102.1 acyl-CoA dehydrogenase [Bacillus sp. ISL-53]MDP9738332.1 butyryl-CoA dehydrogenase [Bacillus sp. B2I3]MEC0271636.1 acyl-CoA dehydrogenase [Peribacillus castrilensis]PAW29586.1 acyl-CoA dehydroge